MLLVVRGGDDQPAGVLFDAMDDPRPRDAAFIQLDRQFHASLARASGHAGLWDLIRTRSGHLDRLRQLHLPSPGKGQAILLDHQARSEEHTSELQSLMRTSYAVFCLKKKTRKQQHK